MDPEHNVTEEAQRHFDHQINSMKQQADQAIEIAKVNILIFSLLAAIIQFSEVPSQVILLAIPLIVSMFVSLLTYLRRAPHFGVAPDDIEKLSKGEGPEEPLSEAYARWIRKNRKRSAQNQKLILLSIVLIDATLGGVLAIIIFV